MKLTIETIEKFLQSEEPQRKCLRCGSMDWTAGTDRNLKAVIPLGDDAASTIVGAEESLPAVWLVCNVCGTVEFIGAKFLRRWLARLERGRSNE